MTAKKDVNTIHYAHLATSARLRRCLSVLCDAAPEGLTTREIIRKSHVCAVNTVVAELKANGIEIDCRCIRRGRYKYTLVDPAAALQTLREADYDTEAENAEG